jgi:hypothetical protein
VFLSGSFATNIIQTPSGTLALANCNPTFVQLQLNDSNFNPMPNNTTVSVIASTIAGAPSAMLGSPAVFPATVNLIGPHDANGNSVVDITTTGPTTGTTTLDIANMAANQGSVHTFAFTPGAGVVSPSSTGAGYCDTSSTKIGNGSLVITITTPKNNTTLYTVYFTFPVSP